MPININLRKWSSLLQLMLLHKSVFPWSSQPSNLIIQPIRIDPSLVLDLENSWTNYTSDILLPNIAHAQLRSSTAAKRKLSHSRNATFHRDKNSSLGPKYIHDERQELSITSDAPAVLIEAGPGTGKTLVLAARIAYLIMSNDCKPHNLIVLSFTKRDAHVLVTKAMDIIQENYNAHYDDYVHEVSTANTHQIESQLLCLKEKIWSGTVHSFASNILTKFPRQLARVMTKRYNQNTNTTISVLNKSQMVARIQLCIGRLASSDQKLLYKEALTECNQQVPVLIQSVIRCIELWKEAALVSPIMFDVERELEKDNFLKEKCIELAIRIGTSMSVTLLSLQILRHYQCLHRSRGTIDPSDLSSLAYEFLLASPRELYTLRSNLQHVIIDEYQDLSVSQHRLVTLILKGEPHIGMVGEAKILPDDPSFPVSAHLHNKKDILFTTPKLFAAGDPYQSIYGWRAASPITTVEGFQRDYPQGVTIPLKTHYRSPKLLLSTAQSLFKSLPSQANNTKPMTTIGFEVSPAAIQSFRHLLRGNFPLNFTHEVMEKLVDKKSFGRITVKALWDEREESKYILSRIRKRWKERAECVSKALHNSHDLSFYDESDVAIMVRSNSQLGVLKEVLYNSNIPFVFDQDDWNGNSATKIPMKPVKILTMHRAKGDEFDDVYLLGWNEGIFPHPACVRTNRVEEERRLAYVALSRSRQRCFITYSFVHRTTYIGPRGTSKKVSEQVARSRFVDDLLKESGPGAQIMESLGFKELIAGQQLPLSFAESYSIPNGFDKPAKMRTAQATNNSILPSPKNDELKGNSIKVMRESMLTDIKKGFDDLSSGKRGFCKMYSSLFRSMLNRLGISRGTALTLKRNFTKNDTMYALYHSKEIEQSKKALSRCTALELCQYLTYILLTKDNQSKI